MINKDSVPLTWVEIDTKAIEHNIEQVRKLIARNTFKVPGRSQKPLKLSDPQHMLAVVKADAYGHGMIETARVLAKKGVGYFGVAHFGEGIALRKGGIRQPVLIFENTLKEFAPLVIKYDLTPTVCTHELAHALNNEAKRLNKSVKVHIKVDTGMGRLGIWHKDAFDFIEQVHRFRHLIIHGIYTHFPCADTDKAFTTAQIAQLTQLIKACDQRGLVIPHIHASNSMGIAGYRTQILNLFRPGLMIYGLLPHPKLKASVKLKSVMSVHSRIIFIKSIEAGRGISYGRTFVAKKTMVVATVPIGYKDGYARALSNKAQVLVGGLRCRVLGRVTMDQIVIDVTKVKPVELGMAVSVLGTQGRETISADELAKHAGTINYEILCALGKSLPRFYR